jgi:hypothetical protein
MIQVDSVENKKMLWDKCSQSNLFSNMTNDIMPKIQELFEDTIREFNNNEVKNENDLQSTNQFIYDSFSNKIRLFNVTNHDDIQNIKNEQTMGDYEKRELEYKSLFNTSKPDDINFSEQMDEPIEGDLSEIIDKQLEQRNNDINGIFLQKSNEKNEENIVISHLPVQKQSMKQEPTMEDNIKEILRSTKIQNKILRQLLETQVSLIQNLTKNNKK